MVGTACISHSVTSFGCETAEEAHLMIVLHSSVYLEICSMGGGGGGGKVEVQDMVGRGQLDVINTRLDKCSGWVGWNAPPPPCGLPL